jgi:N-acetylmuramoyl-L-alanine amidase
MQRSNFYFLFFILFAFPFLSFVPVNKKDPDKPRIAVRTLIIDAGHGGIDQGARGLFSTEAEVSLQVAMKFGEALQKLYPDLKIIYTRTTDMLPGNKPNKDIANRYRAELANQSGGDLYIAIHCNSAGRAPGGWHEKRVVSKTAHYKKVHKGKKIHKVKYYEYRYKEYWVENVAHGTETYIWAADRSGAKANSVSMNNEASGEEVDSTSTLTLPDPSDPAEKARMLIYAQHYFRKSLHLANLVEEHFVGEGRLSRGVKQRNDKGIWVLQATGMPSVLVEIGFISNKEEEKYINSERGQDEIVQTLCNSFKSYVEKEPTKKTTEISSN